jgi:hypothetical protein
VEKVNEVVRAQGGLLELQGGESVPPFLLEVALVADAVRDVKEGKARRLVAEARGERVKARAIQASVGKSKRKRQEDEDGEEEKESDENGGQEAGKGEDEGGDADEDEDKGADEGDENKEDDEEDTEGAGGEVPAKRRRKGAEVSGPPSARC